MQKKSIYKYAAEAGVPTGFYLCAMSACILMSVRIPVLPVLLFPLVIGFPVYLWFIMKKISLAEPAYKKFSSLWLGGIYTVIFGTLICMLFSALYIRFFEPDFVNQYVTNAISAIESSPAASEYESALTLMHDAVEAKVLPTGFQFITTMAWFTCFAGSMLSLALAFIVSKTGRRPEERYSAKGFE